MPLALQMGKGGVGNSCPNLELSVAIEQEQVECGFFFGQELPVSTTVPGT